MAEGVYKHRGIVFRRCPDDDSVWEVLDDDGVVVHVLSKGKLCRTTIDAMLDGSSLPFDPGKKSRPKKEVIPENSMMKVRVEVAKPILDVSKEDIQKYEDIVIKKTSEAHAFAEKKGSKIIIIDLSEIPGHIARSII